MNYLFEYLQLLSGEEIASLGDLRLAPRERALLDYLVSMRGERTEPSKADALQRLGISGSHFDKMSSLLLRTVYEAVVPEGGTQLLYDLNRRDLYRHFVHEMRRQEKELETAPPTTRAAFFLECFTMLLRISRTDYDERLMRELAHKYDRMSPSPDNDLFFEASMIGSLIWNAAARGEGDAYKEEIERRLKENDGRITPTTNATTLFRHLQTYVVYYAQIDTNPSARLEYLERAADLCRRHPDTLGVEDTVLTLCKIAETLYSASDFAEAHRRYIDLLEAHPEILGKDFYHLTKFIQVCIVVDDLKRAEGLLQRYFDPYISSGHRTRGTMAAISYVKLLLCSDRYDEARAFLDLGFRQNKKDFYIQYEIELRLLETAYFHLTGALEFVETLAAKHVKYLRSKGYTIGNSVYYPWFCKLAQAFVEEQTVGTPIGQRLEAKMKEFGEGPAAVYGRLLWKMRYDRRNR